MKGTQRVPPDPELRPDGSETVGCPAARCHGASLCCRGSTPRGLAPLHVLGLGLVGPAQASPQCRACPVERHKAERSSKLSARHHAYVQGVRLAGAAGGLGLVGPAQASPQCRACPVERQKAKRSSKLSARHHAYVQGVRLAGAAGCQQPTCAVCFRRTDLPDCAAGNRSAEEVVLLFLTSGPREGASAEEAATFDLPRRSLRRAAAEHAQASLCP